MSRGDNSEKHTVSRLTAGNPLGRHRILNLLLLNTRHCVAVDITVSLSRLYRATPPSGCPEALPAFLLVSRAKICPYPKTLPLAWAVTSTTITYAPSRLSHQTEQSINAPFSSHVPMLTIQVSCIVRMQTRWAGLQPG